MRGVGGTFPYFIQRSCYHLFEAQIHGRVDSHFIHRQCAQEFLSLWEGYWSKLDVTNKQILYEIADESYAVSSPSTVDSLQDASMVALNNNSLSPFSEEFRHFVLSKSEEISLLTSQPVSRLLEDMDSLRKQLHAYKESALRSDEKLLEQGQHAQPVELAQQSSPKDLQRIVSRQSTTIRLLTSLLILVLSSVGLFLLPRVGQWSFLAQHPKRKGIYVCTTLVIVGICWIIIDPKRRLPVFLYVVVAAILVLVQIS